MNSRSGLTTQILQLLRPYWPLVLGGSVLGVVGGASVAALLAVVNHGLYATQADVVTLFFAFAGLCLLILIGSIGADISANYVGQRIIAELRKSLAAKILAAPIDQLEIYRTHRLIPVLTQDVDTISDFAFFFSSFFVSLVIALGCMVYLAVLSWQLFLITGVVIVLGSLAHGYARTRGVRGFSTAREAEDQLHKQYRAIAEGAKELRLNRVRRRRVYVEQLQQTVDRISSVQIRSINLFVTARAFGTMLFFVVIGVALTLRPFLWPDSPAAVSSGFVLVLLFMRGPIDQVIGILPALGRAQVAMRRIAELSEQFSTPEHDLLASAPAAPAKTTIESIELRGVTYAFRAVPGSDPFVLGPVDLFVRQGDIVFIVGQNGSGKTTLIKLLLGLYAPHGGAVLCDGSPVLTETRDDYRQLFTTIFSDYYLFEDLIRGEGVVPDVAERYLQRLEIAHKVSVENGVFTTTDLSTGQRKRLALMNAWLEERPVLVFDEWAADQDPAFRHIFYTELLPDLKRLGKTIIVISHDDRYFGIADHLVRLRDGKIVASEARASNVVGVSAVPTDAPL
ncbi:cyclic peptide export ABC transporter [Bradyrhizobium sp. NBAIM20]|uniref:cyclic peptide export ABC transporter n=1 Tax=unclassified Bradyrhizobium TaxID=2631580 RepID=UPI001CD2F865|nr:MULTISPECIES: cyclic peptide export ABC transporter [unclassified Bradyrhizobium]MCA1413754.1 cyclic peptide export ABC transporter [Bradyrhizobium sp. NBAIM20]MCA1460441.1 cyclic peptide export ABC transporter [Bradyrhizobium sp. NBAIM18]